MPPPPTFYVIGTNEAIHLCTVDADVDFIDNLNDRSAALREAMPSYYDLFPMTLAGYLNT